VWDAKLGVAGSNPAGRAKKKDRVHRSFFFACFAWMRTAPTNYWGAGRDRGERHPELVEG